MVPSTCLPAGLIWSTMKTGMFIFSSDIEENSYLRLLYARVGRTFSPLSGCEVKRHTTEDVVQCALSYSPGTRFTVLAPVRVPDGRTLREQLEIDLKQGLTRIDAGGEMMRIEGLSRPARRRA